jgi:hypothetical protein
MNAIKARTSTPGALVVAGRDREKHPVNSDEVKIQHNCLLSMDLFGFFRILVGDPG